MSDIKSMFESIKESLNAKESSNNNAFRNFLKMEAGKSYLVRFIPNVGDPKSTFFHYAHHGFTSLSTGQYVDATCPRSFGERCPICEVRFKLYKTKKEDDRNLAYMIRSHDKHMVNVYVVNDPTNAENEGTVKILRFGKRIHDKILDATEGDDASEFGPRVYDLTENGCNFKIKVETAQDGTRKFTNYNNSRFTAPCAIPNMDTDKIKEVYDSIFDLTKILEMKSEDELNDILKNHVFCEGGAKPVEGDTPPPKNANKSVKTTIIKPEPKEEDDVPYNTPAETKAETKTESKKSESKKEGASTDAKIKNLLDGLDRL